MTHFDYTKIKHQAKRKTYYFSNIWYYFYLFMLEILYFCINKKKNLWISVDEQSFF